MHDSGASSFRPLLVKFRDEFTATSFGNFVDLTMAWIVCTSRHRLSRAVVACRELGGSTKHHSAYYRFFSTARWAVDGACRVLFLMAVHFVPGVALYLSVDDSLTRRTGPQIWGAGMHHDPLLSNYNRGSRRSAVLSFGHSWVIVCLWIPLPWAPYRGLAIPVAVRLYRSRKTCPEADYAKRTELAAELLNLVASWAPAGRRLHIAGDREYSCQTVLRSLPEDAVYIGHLPMNAALYAPPSPRAKGQRGRPRKKGERLPNPKQLAQATEYPWELRRPIFYGKPVPLYIKSLQCLWYGVTGPQLVRIVVTRDPKGHLDNRAFVCTDPSMDPDEIVRIFSLRWEQEAMHRNLKQHLGLNDPQNGWWRRPHGKRRNTRRPGPEAHTRRGAAATTRTVPFILLTYGIIVLWYLRNGTPQDDVARARRLAPWYLHKAAPSFADMLTAARYAVLRDWNFAGPASEQPLPKTADALLEVCMAA